MTHFHIYHICTSKSWRTQIDSSQYVHESLDIENFIHSSSEKQIKGVLKRYFEGVNDLLLLTIESNKVIPNIKYEKAENGEYYPHIFGPLNKDAIVNVSEVNKSK